MQSCFSLFILFPRAEIVAHDNVSVVALIVAHTLRCGADDEV